MTALLEISDLTVAFPARNQNFIAVDSANLTVEPGEIHGLVGESGAGKSTIGAAVATGLFALLHMGPGREFRLWTVFALVAGALLGGLMVWSMPTGCFGSTRGWPRSNHCR